MLLALSLALSTLQQGGGVSPRLRPPAPPVADTVLKAVHLVLERGDSLAHVYPSLWARGARFVIGTDRDQIVLAAPGPAPERFLPATDSSGRVVLPGRLWVAPRYTHPWDTAGIGAIRTVTESLPTAYFGAPPTNFETVVNWDVPQLIRALLESALRLHPTLLPVAARPGYQRRAPASVHSSCRAAACTPLIAAQRGRTRRALVATTREARLALVREALAIRWLWDANQPSEFSGQTTPSVEAADLRALINGTAIILSRDSAAYDSSLVESLADSNAGDWVYPRDRVTEAAADLRLLDRLGVDWRPGVAAGLSADSLLRAAVRFDPLAGIAIAERALRSVGLGGVLARTPGDGPEDRQARADAAARTEFFAAGMQRVVGDTFPLAIELPMLWVRNGTVQLTIDPGPAGAVLVGTAGNAVYPRAARIQLRAPAGVEVDLRDVPALVEYGSSMDADRLRLMLFLPDSVLTRQLPGPRAGAAGIFVLRLDTPAGTIQVGNLARIDRTCCYYMLRP